MPGKPGFRVQPSWPRPDAALLAAFGSAASAQVADCMSRLGAMDAGIRPVWRSPRISGPAVTVWPGDIVIADRDGITIVPLHDAEEVARLAAALIEREEQRLAEIDRGVLVRPEIDEALRRLKIVD